MTSPADDPVTVVPQVEGIASDPSKEGGPPTSSTATTEGHGTVPVVSYEDHGTAPTGTSKPIASDQNGSVSGHAVDKDTDKGDSTDKSAPESKAVGDSPAKSKDTVDATDATSHDSESTNPTAESARKTVTRDPHTTPTDDPKNGAEGDKNALVSDDSTAVNAILWEAGLSKAEKTKRTKVDGGEVKELDLERCEQMTDLPQQIGLLTKLRTLNLSGCVKIKTLPSEIQSLHLLEELYLTNCHDLVALPPEIGKLTSLKELYLTNCWNLESLPPEIGQLQNLNELYLTGCKELMKLPPEIGQLSNLTELKLFSCSQLKELPPEVANLNKLTKLDLRMCEGLQELPSEIGQLNKLTTLNLTGCRGLHELPNEIGQLKKLTELILKDCTELEVLPADLTQLSQLTELILDGCTKLRKLAPELRYYESAAKMPDDQGGLGDSEMERRKSALDLIGIAAAHLEKVPESYRGSAVASKKVARGHNLDLGKEFFENVPLPPKPDEEIPKVGEHDVLCGRGGETNHHQGNVRYRTLVKEHQVMYIHAKRLDKPRIALKIVNMVRKNGGRFLKKDTASGTYRDVGNQKAREKTSQTLREGAPELRDPNLPPHRIIKGSAGMPVVLPIDPSWQEMMMNKRKGDVMLPQSPRKRFKLPLHPRRDSFPHVDPRMMEDEDFRSDPLLNEHLVRGPRLQIRHPDPTVMDSPPGAPPGAPPVEHQVVVAPTALDVVYGKGKAIQDHVGNIRFRKIVDMHRQSYHSAYRRADKTQISKEIVQWIRSMGGRFLQLDFTSGKYHDVGDETARDKVSHALRSRKDPSRPSSGDSPTGGSPIPHNSYLPPEERAKVLAYQMDLVRQYQNQDRRDLELSYYQQRQRAERGERLPVTPEQKQRHANMLATIAGSPGSAMKHTSPTKAGKSEEDVARGDWPLRDVKEPHENDVLYGRGGKSNHHPGNKRFRQAVKDRELDYIRKKNKDKQMVAMEIVRAWRSQVPPGRFLKKDEKTGLWNDVGDSRAREKTSQAFREIAPHQQSSPGYQNPVRVPMAPGMDNRPEPLMWGGRYPPIAGERLQAGNDQPRTVTDTKENQAEV